MRLVVLGLQAAVADGSEPTFDGQPMQAGNHLRWSFSPQLGFPPGAFWLARQAASHFQHGAIQPPEVVSEAIATQCSWAQPKQGQCDGKGLACLVPVGAQPPSSTCKGCGRCCCCLALAALRERSGSPVRPTVAQGESEEKKMLDRPRCECGHLLACVGRELEGPRERGAECGCCRCAATPAVSVSVTIVCCCGCGEGGNGGSGPGQCTTGSCQTGTITPGSLGLNPTGPAWGPPDGRGWRVWGEPFTMPLTRENWPARYFGALDPQYQSEAALLARDVLECEERLNGRALQLGMSAQATGAYFTALREECARLVEGWPGEANYEVGLQGSADGPHAPNLSLRLVSQLQLAALNPYMARVLGLYFVDSQTEPHKPYDYCLIGVWDSRVPPQVRSPGGAPTRALARGEALFEGLSIVAEAANSHLYSWQREGPSEQSSAEEGSSNTAGPTVPPEALPGTPHGVTAALVQAVTPLAQGERPPALLVAEANPSAPLSSGALTVCRLDLLTPVAEISLALAGTGTLTAYCEEANGNKVEVAKAEVKGTILTWYPLASPDPTNKPIQELVVSTGLAGSVIVIGSLVSSPVLGADVGVRYAIVHHPQKMKPPPAPSQPITWFRRRTAEIDPVGRSIVASSFFEVLWASPPPREERGDPVQEQTAMPPPTGAVGYLAWRRIHPPAGQPLPPDEPLGRVIAATPQELREGSQSEGPQPEVPQPPFQQPIGPFGGPMVLRFVDAGRPDPGENAGYQHRTAAFGLFGQRSPFSAWSDPRGIERIAAAPTLRLLTLGAAQSIFDNTQAGGGAPDGQANAWVGGTLEAIVSWSASSLLAYHDVQSARLSVAEEEPSETVLAKWEFAVPPPAIVPLKLTRLVYDEEHGVTYAVTEPPLVALAAEEPSASLTLLGVLANGGRVFERFAVRPAKVEPTPAAWPADLPADEVVATLIGGPGSRVVANPSAFLGQVAYLVLGVSVGPHELHVPLRVPIEEKSVRAKAVVAVSREPVFVENEQIVDPNTSANRDEPSSNAVVFVAPQRLQPPSAANVKQVPSHTVDHLYYTPADYNGNAFYTLPFDLSPGKPAGVSGYLLKRAPAHSLFVADIQRRRSVGLLDPNPSVEENNQRREDLEKWIEVLPAWLAAYNHRTSAQLTETSVLTDPAGLRALVEHFYRGLLDDELRALADITPATPPARSPPGNEAAFAQVSPNPIEPSASPLTDEVNGNGFGCNLYQLCAVNGANSRGAPTQSFGPIYTRTVRPSRAPVLYKVTPQPSTGAFIVAWALDASPDISGYLVYRVQDSEEPPDLRWFGPDPEHPLEQAKLALPQVTPGAWEPLSLTAGESDRRLVGVVNDPRVFARDYKQSDMGEVALPPGEAPEEILGVYRFAEFEAKTPEAQPGAFNYWLPAALGGTAQLVTQPVAGNTIPRITGLRLGLGRGVPVVVVARYKGVIRTIGSQPVMRAAFVDGPQVPGAAPLKAADPNAVSGWQPVAPGQSPAYAVAAVDIAGNRSPASKIFTVPALMPA